MYNINIIPEECITCRHNVYSLSMKPHNDELQYLCEQIYNININPVEYITWYYNV